MHRGPIKSSLKALPQYDSAVMFADVCIDWRTKATNIDCKKNTDQTYSCPRGWRLSRQPWAPNWGLPLKPIGPSQHWRIEGLKGAPITVLYRIEGFKGNITAARCEFFQLGHRVDEVGLKSPSQFQGNIVLGQTKYLFIRDTPHYSKRAR